MVIADPGRDVVASHFEDPSDFEQLLDSAEEADPTGEDADFVAEVRERYELYATRAYLSQRQLEKLRRIAGEEE